MLAELPDNALEMVLRTLPLDDQARTACCNRRLRATVEGIGDAAALRREFCGVLQRAVLRDGREVILSDRIPGGAWVMGGEGNDRRLCLMPIQDDPKKYCIDVFFATTVSWLIGGVKAFPVRIKAPMATFYAQQNARPFSLDRVEKHGLEGGLAMLPTDERVVAPVRYLTHLSATPSLAHLFL